MTNSLWVVKGVYIDGYKDTANNLDNNEPYGKKLHVGLPWDLDLGQSSLTSNVVAYTQLDRLLFLMIYSTVNSEMLVHHKI